MKPSNLNFSSSTFLDQTAQGDVVITFLKNFAAGSHPSQPAFALLSSSVISDSLRL